GALDDLDAHFGLRFILLSLVLPQCRNHIPAKPEK
ncbi:MAG: hypothetical protein ACI9BW_002236, partial [Gammaproteobacteria bacterium]